MRKIFLLTLVFLSSMLVKAQNGLENVIVETYYVSDAADEAGSVGTLPIGSVTYRIYIDMLPGYKFQALYGVNNPDVHELRFSTTTSFFNNEDRGNTSPSFTKNNAKLNTVGLDSWFSVGAACSGNYGVLKADDTDGSIYSGLSLLQNTATQAGIALKTQDGIIPPPSGVPAPESVTFVGLTTELDVFADVSQAGNLFSTVNGSIAALNGASGPTPDNRVLIGQFTTDGKFCFELNIQIGTPSGGTENYVARNPKGNEISIPELTFCSSGVGVQKFASNVFSFNAYPNPAKESFTLVVNRYSNSTELSNYRIRTVDGKIVLQKELGQISNHYTEVIDVSSLPDGVYFLEMNVDGVCSVQKIVKL